MVFIFDEILTALCELGLAEGSIRQYIRYFRKMQCFFLEKGASGYSERILDEYWISVTQREIPYSQKYLSSLWKSVCIVKKYVAGDGVSCSFLTHGSRYNPGPYFQDIIDSSIESLLLEGSTRTWYSTVTRKFCCQLEKKGIVQFSDMKLSDVSQIMTKFGQSNPNSMGSVTMYISKFLLYLNKVGACTVQIESSLYVPCSRKKLIPAYSADELRHMFGACDRNTKIGKRDYAILLLAASCGLRRSDISRMNLSDIDWERYVIRLTQKKTGKALSIPMPAETGNAVADYILEGRPKETGHIRVFLTSRAPLRPLEPSAINDRLLIICGKASITKLPGRNFHSLRRSVGTFMAASEVPVTTISQVLGHSDCKSADRYISANPAMMSCSLDFTGIPVTSEVYQ
jgi:site-specific recombinase XerD